ncbi:MAG: hypothetical protein IJO21_02040 [Oscillospiraceae bacterium]|nr:hypothetical protein [Oscillospiraceae bacterium]
MKPAAAEKVQRQILFVSREKGAMAKTAGLRRIRSEISPCIFDYTEAKIQGQSPMPSDLLKIRHRNSYCIYPVA